MAGRSAPRFGHLSGYPSGSTSDNPTEDPFPVPIINPSSVLSETTTKYHYNATEQIPSANKSNMLIEYLSEDPTGATITTPIDKES